MAILGIRGLPAAHGGFETFAERLSLHLVANGWRVTVYCQQDGAGEVHEDDWQGVHRVHIPCGDDNAAATVRFDWRAIAHVLGHRPDVALTLGYNTALFCARLRLAGIPNAINMDGIEWKRDKWGPLARAWLYANDWAGCLLGNQLIADHPAIASHLATRVSRDKIAVIPYGADRIDDIDTEPLQALGLESGAYLTLIARPEAENSVLEIVRAFSAKPRGVTLVVLGRYLPEQVPYHREVLDAAGPEVRFVGAIYDAPTVQALRRHSLLYVHGHRVGGTNPSLVEALGAGNPVLAHQNRFNHWVAGHEAMYFDSEAACSRAFDELFAEPERLVEMAIGSALRHMEAFRWDKVLLRYEQLLARLIRDRSARTRERGREEARPAAAEPQLAARSNTLAARTGALSLGVVSAARRFLLLAVLLVPLLLLLQSLGGCASPPPPQGVSIVAAAQDDAALRRANELPAAAEPVRYLIGAGDELELRFPDYAQYDQSAKVRPDGKVSLQVIGAVHVLGRTPEDVQQELWERYRQLAGGAGERSYLIHPGDELEVKFPYQANLNEVARVRPDGKLTLQLVGTLVAQGLSPEELQAELVRRYARVLRAPELAVIMRSFSSQALRVGPQGQGRAGAEYLRPVVMLKTATPQQVFVGGEVQRPGMLPFTPGMTLMQALVQAGGQLPSAELRAATVLRKAPGREPLVIRRDLAADLAGRATNDVVLEASDVVVLPQTAVAALGQTLDQYVFKLIPPLRNSSFGFIYDLRGRRY
ncbi:MAG: polysaccharide biosynthesis/export family protein [Burkholderiales bacterium]